MSEAKKENGFGRGKIPTTGIGSLPHPYVDAALAHCFRLEIPYLPQLPMKNAREFMLVQAMDQLPGLDVEEGGIPILDEQVWRTHSERLRERTDKAFENSSDEHAFESFEPTIDMWQAWTAFLWELQERNYEVAKIQLAGPMTCQWALRLKDGTAAEKHSDICMQVYRLVLARSIAMCRKVKSIGVKPLFFLDEPGFYGFSMANPLHQMRFQELKLFIQTLQKEDVVVGLHCCSNTDWGAILSLGVDVLSIDANLSLVNLMEQKEALREFIFGGGRLSLGLIPTGTHSVNIRSYQPKLLVDSLKELLEKGTSDSPTLMERILDNCLITPACGLALHSIQDANLILSHTLEAAKLLRR